MALNIKIEMVELSCTQCGVVFMVPKQWYEQSLLDKGRRHYCPNGHRQKFQAWRGVYEAEEAKFRKASEDNQRLRNELARAKMETERLEAETSESTNRDEGQFTEIAKKVVAESIEWLV